MADSSKILSYLNLSDDYERKARFMPALLAICAFLPAALALSIPLLGWLTALITGAGVASIACVGISHLASAMGNRFQLKLYPEWPYDSPTNLRLSPFDSSSSKEQKHRWYSEIKAITGLNVQDAPLADRKELERLINDAVTAIRTALWKHPNADRIHTHNAEYGFARNFAGLAPIWLTLSALSTGICWIAFGFLQGDIAWAIASSVITVGLLLLYRFILDDYVATKAEHYADSFFDALNLLNASDSTSTTGDSSDTPPAQELARME